MPCQPLPKSPTSTVRLAGLTLYPAETDASRRDAERVVNENRQAAARFAFGHAAVSPDAAIAAIEAGIMVPQPCQQAQAGTAAPLDLDGLNADMLDREAAACRRTAARFREKAEASNAVEAGSLRHAATRLDADAAQAEHDAEQLRTTTVPQVAQQEPSWSAPVAKAANSRFNVYGSRGGLGSVLAVDASEAHAKAHALFGSHTHPGDHLRVVIEGLNVFTGERVAMVPQPCQQQQARAVDPLCPVMDAAYFERMAAKMADPAWPNIAPILAEADRAAKAAAARYVAAQKAAADRLGIDGRLALSGRYGRAA